MAAVYHLLDEAEIFSERDGGAISRWAANVLREGSEIVICPSFDASWDFPAERVYQLPNWSLTDPIHPVLYRLPWPLQKNAYLFVLRGLLQKLKRGDLLYIHNRPAPAAALSTVAAQHGVQIVLHMHNSHLIQASKGQLDALRKTPIVFCSRFLEGEANRALPNHFESTHVVHNGADGKKFHCKREGRNPTPTIIYTGRLVPYKGVHVLLEAMRILERNKINARCKIVGGAKFGNSRSTRYVRKLQRRKSSNTELLGYLAGESLAEQLRGADIFCCPSVWNDPFPMALLEGMATGLPVVASETGGIPEQLAHGGGVLVPPNDPQALATALERLVQDTVYREELSAKALASFKEHFFWSGVRKQYERVVQGLLA
ncbi:MAG TPA: glycosyltransferase family 4 protein [Terriglobia bacterium]|nr:glycosyltransferase family 4 protein [Terriglobia bacterium]